MKATKETMIAAVCLVALAGCAQSEQRSELSTEHTSTTTGTEATASTEQSGTGEIYEGTIAGVISDSMCGKDHSPMGELGKDPAACTKKCVEQGAKFVLVDKQGVAYKLSDQDKAQELAGQAVSIEGHIDPKEKAIHVHSIAAR